MEFINITQILRDPEIVKSLSYANGDLQTGTPPLSDKFFNFKNFLNHLDLDIFLSHPVIYYANVLTLFSLKNTLTYSNRAALEIHLGSLQLTRASPKQTVFS